MAHGASNWIQTSKLQRTHISRLNVKIGQAYLATRVVKPKYKYPGPPSTARSPLALSPSQVPHNP